MKRLLPYVMAIFLSPYGAFSTTPAMKGGVVTDEPAPVPYSPGGTGSGTRGPGAGSHQPGGRPAVKEDAGAKTTVTLISASDSSTVFEVEFAEPFISDVNIDGRVYSRYSVPGCSAAGEPGAPELSVRNVWVAVPEGANVTVAVEDSDYGVASGVNLCPRPREKRVERSGYEALEEDFFLDRAAYAVDTHPARAAEVLDNAKVRGLRAVKVGVHAYSYRPTDGTLRLFDRVRVRVSHPGGKTRSAVPESERSEPGAFERALSRVILNYGVASRWPVAAGPFVNLNEEIWPGRWPRAYKVIVKDTGFYRISYDYLLSHGFDTSVDPTKLHLYAGSGEMLPKSVYDPVTGVQEVPMVVTGEVDGRLDPGDCLEFFGHGTNFFEDTGTELVLKRHKYSDYNVYWLVVEDAPGLRYDPKDCAPSSAGVPVSTYAYRVYFETDRSYEGYRSQVSEDDEKWFWFTVYPGNSHDEGFNIRGLNAGASGVPMLFKFLVRGFQYDEPQPNSTRIYANVMDEGHVLWENLSWGPGLEITEEVIVEDPGIFKEGGNYVYVEELPGAGNLHPLYFSHFELEYPRSYKAHNDYLMFSNPADRQGEILFDVSGFTSEAVNIYDVTDGRIVTGFETRQEGSGYTFRFEDAIETGRRWYVAATDSSKLEPVDLYMDSPSDLQTPEAENVLVITNEKFRDSLLPLCALRRSQGYKVGLYNITDVFDEFACGVLDPVAIRNFVKYRYDSPVTRPTFIILVGDASYDFKDNYGHHDKEYRYFGGNLVPTMYVYTIGNGDSASDNFYACVDGDDVRADVFVGRFSARFEDQLTNMVDKVLRYERSPDFGSWRTRSLLAADNDDKAGEGQGGSGNFTRDYEVLLIPPYVPPGLGIDKTYIEWMNRHHEGFDFMLRNERTPLVREEMTPDLLESFEHLLVQYSGHGGPQIWSHEDLFIHGAHARYDVEGVLNYNRYPIVMEMSCSNSKFDDVSPVTDPTGNECLNEYLMHPRGRGAVATTGSSRLGTEGAQSDYLEGFYMTLFPDQEIPDARITLGEAFWGGKMFSDTTRLWSIYTLLGDPAMVVGVPRPNITDVNATPNPVKRGGVLTVTGSVPGVNAGVVEVSLYDKPLYFHSDDIDADVHRERPLSKAVDEITAGNFSLELPVPVTAGWGYDDGGGSDIDDALVRVYAYDAAAGKDFVLPEDYTISVKGEVDSDDNTGPSVEIFFDDYSFRSYDPVGPTPEMIITISDPSGVLVSPFTEDYNENFRPITFWIDSGDEIDVTEYFKPTVGDWRSGEIRRKIYLGEGNHTVTVRAYDNLMNETERSVSVRVSGDLVLSEVYNCPNPFAAGGTYFTFINSAPLDNAVVRIYTVTGKLIKKLEATNLPAGYNEVFWSGLDGDDDEIANGVYFYKITARSGVRKCEVKQKLIKMG